MENTYRVYIGKVLLPVTPSKITFKTKGANQTYNLINNEQINVIKPANLQEISFDFLLPATKYPFAVYQDGFKRPDRLIKEIKKYMKNQEAITFQYDKQVSKNKILTNSFSVTIEDLTQKEDAKEGRDVTVSISLKRYRAYGTVIVEEKSSDGGTNKQVKETSRTTSTNAPGNSLPTTYTIKSGDTLWALAKKYYGDGSMYTAIASANNISNPNKITVGKKLTIPDSETATKTISSNTAKSTAKADYSRGGSKTNPPYTILSSSYGVVVSGLTTWNAAQGYYNANNGKSRGWKIADKSCKVVTLS